MKTITLSKTIKLPIPGITFSNKVVSVTIEYDEKDFKQKTAIDEINELLTQLKDKDPGWIQTYDKEQDENTSPHKNQ